MHISEGVLSGPVLLAGAVLSVAGVAVGLRKTDLDSIMKVAILAAAFFVAALIHVPIGPSSAHLTLNGLVGVVLGWAAFPAIAVALALQAVLFQFGGLTALGANVFNMAAPAVVVYYLFGPMLASARNGPRLIGSFAAGFLAVGMSALLTAVALGASDQGFTAAAKSLVILHLPIMVVEGFVTMFVFGFLAKVRPEILRRSPSRT